MDNKQMIYKIEGIITAMSQVTQSGDQKTGATQLLPVKGVWHDGDAKDVPYISGNSIRGRLRRLIIEDLCHQLDYTFTDEHVWHAFFGGGQLQSVGPGGVIDVGLRRTISELLPPIVLWGFSLGNQVLESKMIVHDMDVLCEEMRECLPARYQQYCAESFYSYLSEMMFTRKDDKQSGRVKDENEAAIQMKVGVQVFVPGTRFYHCFILRKYPTPVEISCLHRAIELWQQIPTIGGKSASGYGQLKHEYEGVIDGSAYLDFIETRKDTIIEFLDKLTADFKENLKKAKAKS